jgi:hypothetical protein
LKIFPEISAVFLFISISINAVFCSDRESIPEKNIILLGNQSFSPMIFRENGRTQGIVIDIAGELQKRIGGYHIELGETDGQVYG